jgi:hypothetical protein
MLKRADARVLFRCFLASATNISIDFASKSLISVVSSPKQVQSKSKPEEPTQEK